MTLGVEASAVGSSVVVAASAPRKNGMMMQLKMVVNQKPVPHSFVPAFLSAVSAAVVVVVAGAVSVLDCALVVA